MAALIPAALSLTPRKVGFGTFMAQCVAFHDCVREVSLDRTAGGRIHRRGNPGAHAESSCAPHARRGNRRRGAVIADALSLPCMMCTCCTAPIALSLRRRGVPASAAVSYWLGNPTLNPAVLAMLAMLLPWQFTLTRLVAGALVFALPILLDRVAAPEPPLA
jgi:hypothetical protein